MFTIYLLPINTIAWSALKVWLLGFKVLLFLSAICWTPPHHHHPSHPCWPQPPHPLPHVILFYEDPAIHVFMFKLWVRACHHDYSLGSIKQSRNFNPPIITGTCKVKQELVCMFLQKITASGSQQVVTASMLKSTVAGFLWSCFKFYNWITDGNYQNIDLLCGTVKLWSWVYSD